MQTLMVPAASPQACLTLLGSNRPMAGAGQSLVSQPHQQLLHQAEHRVTHQKGIKRLLLTVLSIWAQSTAAEAAHAWPEPCGHLPIQPPASRTTLLWQ